ncbi:MAG: SoxR reducing system RseC family protein [Motiliproteus sp.]
MLTENGLVVDVGPDGVRVETVRQNACSGCRSQAGCGQKMLAEIGQGQRFEISAANPSQLILQLGDRVELGIEEASFLQASAMVYLVPLLGLIIAAILTDTLGAAEPWVISAGVSGLLLGFGVVRWWTARGQSCRYVPQILRVIRL